MGGGGGRREDDDDIILQPPRTISPEEPFYSEFIKYFRDVGPFYIVAKPTSILDFANLTLGFQGAVGKNSKLVGGKLLRG